MHIAEVRRIGACFTAAALLEVCIEPSPGLVNPKDSGAHKDMSHLTFMVGGSVLAPYYSAFAELGWEHGSRMPKGLFLALRELGVQAEKEMLEVTQNVNTQRGQLFVLGLGAGFAGFCLSRGEKVSSGSFYEMVRQGCGGLCRVELSSLGDARLAGTTGERLYIQYGVKGARGEAEAGFPTVQTTGYPAFREGLERGLGINDAAVHALLSIMAVVEDTTVLGRLGPSGLSMLHDTSRKILALGGVFTEDGRRMTVEAHRRFSDMGLSPGGAADLLALSMALYFVENGLPGRYAIMTPSLFAGER